VSAKAITDYVVLNEFYFVVIIILRAVCCVVNLLSVADAGAASSVSHTCPHQPSPSASHSYSVCDLRCSHVDHRNDASSLVCMLMHRLCT